MVLLTMPANSGGIQFIGGILIQGAQNNRKRNYRTGGCGQSAGCPDPASGTGLVSVHLAQISAVKQDKTWENRIGLPIVEINQLIM